VTRGFWRNRSNRRAVPLSKIQTDVLRLLASHRDPESYVAGATPLNRDAARYSDDIDVFHDREERVAAAALHDAQALTEAGYRVSWLRQLPLIYTAEVIQKDAGTRLEWVVDSDFRFFPTMPDESFGYMLHPVDLAANKVMAAAGRREVRDRLHTRRTHCRNPPERQLPGSRVARLPDYQTHAGQRRGQWPGSPEITAAMFERYRKPPAP
jgi:hypothetical protein